MNKYYQEVFLNNILEFAGNNPVSNTYIEYNFSLIESDDKLILITFYDSYEKKNMKAFNKTHFFNIIKKKNDKQKKLYIIFKDSDIKDSQQTSLTSDKNFVEQKPNFKDILFCTKLMFLTTKEEFNKIYNIKILTPSDIFENCTIFMDSEPDKTTKLITKHDTICIRHQLSEKTYIEVRNYSGTTNTFTTINYLVSG